MSTRGQAAPVPFATALVDGLAPDGGLYVPETIPSLEPRSAGRIATTPFVELGTEVLAPYVASDIDRATLERLVAYALDFPIPLRYIADNIYVLELFHGPTLAFKDIGARTLARFTAHFASVQMPAARASSSRGRDDRAEGSRAVTVLVATSGDTGGAVASAFHGVAGTRVVVLYPDGQVSPTQEAQFATIGGNVLAVAVQGTFDDCQALVKRAFADRELRQSAHLTSANSINVGRLLPQAIYYWHAVAELQARGIDTRDVVISVPSGNFGNLTAGVLAKRMGAPIGRFVAATNVNDVVPEFLQGAPYRPRPSVRTISNAMDVGDPSNFARLLWLYGDGAPNAARARMNDEIAGSSHTDADVRETMRRVDREHGYLLDPHSAVAWRALEELSGPSRPPSVVVATAHPAKFREIVEPIVGREIDVPAPLRAALARPRTTRKLSPDAAALRALLLENGSSVPGT